jgi:hypothetical protein
MKYIIVLLLLATSLFALDNDLRLVLQVIPYDFVVMRDGSSQLVIIDEKMTDGTLVVQVPSESTKKVILHSEYKDLIPSQTAYQVISQRWSWYYKHNDPDDLLLTVEWARKWIGNDRERSLNMAHLLNAVADTAFEKWPDNAELNTMLGPYLLNDKNIK